MIPEEQVEELLIGVKTPIHLSEAGEEIVEDVVEEKKVVQTRRCQPLLPLGTSILFSNPASQSQPGRCDDRNSALKWPGGRRETYEIAFSLYFREINKRCTICLVLWHYLGLKLLPRSVSTDGYQGKFRS